MQICHHIRYCYGYYVDSESLFNKFYNDRKLEKYHLLFTTLPKFKKFRHYQGYHITLHEILLLGTFKKFLIKKACAEKFLETR